MNKKSINLSSFVAIKILLGNIALWIPIKTNKKVIDEDIDKCKVLWQCVFSFTTLHSFYENQIMPKTHMNIFTDEIYLQVTT